MHTALICRQIHSVAHEIFTVETASFCGMMANMITMRYFRSTNFKSGRQRALSRGPSWPFVCVGQRVAQLAQQHAPVLQRHRPLREPTLQLHDHPRHLHDDHAPCKYSNTTEHEFISDVTSRYRNRLPTRRAGKQRQNRFHRRRNVPR